MVGGRLIEVDAMTPNGVVGCRISVAVVVMLTFLRLADGATNLTSVLDDILQGYDSRIRPNGRDDLPLHVRVQVYIESVDSIRESTMDFTVTLYLRLYWQDPRLAFEGNHSLVLGSQGIERIWVPDIYFLYDKNARVHTVTQPNQLMRIEPSGELSYSSRITLTVSCNMHLQKFPMDSQNCSIVMSSYAYPVEDLILYVDEESINTDSDIAISKFTLTDKKIEEDSLHFALGNFSSVRCVFYFMRQMESYFLTVYIPTVLLVSIAWLSFWIDARAAPARVALGITTVLTVTTMTAGIQETLPVVTYAKAIDVWLVVCLMFVFFSLLEYGMANFLLVKQDNRIATNKISNDIDESKDVHEVSIQGRPLTADRLDRLARLLYPVLFLCFCVCYWIVFLIM